MYKMQHIEICYAPIQQTFCKFNKSYFPFYSFILHILKYRSQSIISSEAG